MYANVAERAYLVDTKHYVMNAKENLIDKIQNLKRRDKNMKYRKKPVVIEAFKYDGDLKVSDGKYYIPDWAVKAYEDGVMFYGDIGNMPGELFIKTLEGAHHASVGDYIIQGVNGEIYPCKPDIFEKTYELAE